MSVQPRRLFGQLLLSQLLLALLVAPAAWAQFPIPVVGPGDYTVVQLEHTADGALYAIGMFEDSLAIEPMAPQATIRWSAPNPTGFLARFDSQGTLEWVHVLEARRQGFNDPSSVEARRIAVLPDGSVALLGTITAGIEIDLDPGAGQALVTSGGTGAFVVRYDADGAYRWHGFVEMAGAGSLVNQMGLDAADDVVFALFPPGPDTDPGPGVISTTTATIVAMQASDGATVYVQETSFPAGSIFNPALAQDLAAGGGSVYVLAHIGNLATARFIIARHDAVDGAETWTYTPSTGRDQLVLLEADGAGILYAAGELSSSSTGIALDPAAPNTLTHAREGSERTALAAYGPDGSLLWSVRTADNIGAFGKGFDVADDQLFVSGSGDLNVYGSADGALVRSLPEVFGSPSLYALAAGTGNVSVYVDPTGNDARRFQGLPVETPPTAIVRLRESDLSLVATSSERNALPNAAFTLGTVHPNPVADRSDVVLRLPAAAHTRLAVYDLLGRRLSVLTDGTLPPGDHVVSFDARDLVPGLYVLVLQSAEQFRTRPFVVAR